MPILKLIALSRWTLAICLVVSISALLKEHPRTMAMRQGEVHHITGRPIDAHTRIVATEAARRLRAFGESSGQVQARAQATFTIEANPLDPLPAPALAALQYAASIWAQLINSPVPIEIYARWTPSISTLGSGNTSIWRDFPNAPVPNVWYPKPLADAIAGYDISPSAGGISLIFNSSVDWYFGTDGRTPAGQYDFVTVALHEITHSLGFIPLMWADEGGWGQWSVMQQNDASIYSRFVVNGAGQSLLNTSLFPNPSAALGSQLTSNNLFWSGAAGSAALGGTRPRLYAPNPFVLADFGSLAHLDEVTHPAGTANSMMTPVLNTAEAIHVPGPAVMGMLADMGWAPDVTCSYSVDRSEISIGPAATSVVVNVLAPATCQWTATSNTAAFVVTAGAAGNGPSPVTIAVSANAGAYRSGTLTIAGQTVTIRQNGNGPTMTLDRTVLQFGAASLGGTFSAQTTAQVLRLRQTGIAGTVSWTAHATEPWLQVSPASGTGSADLSVSVTASPGLPISGQVSGSIQLTFTGAGNVVGPIAVTLTLVQNGLTAAPFGTVDTPADMQSGVTGAIAMTGWALDDVDVDRIAICRLPYWFESPSPNPECDGRADVFVGYAVRVEGARPDVQTAFPGYPLNHKGGWGFMILTNMLPLGGPSGYSYTFVVTAFDREGRTARLGVRTIWCANDVATKPFGAIDTPEQGGIASGGAYINFGWALTPQPKTIPIDGSTITVLIDGSPVGNVSYNHYRSDIATLFPNRNNSNGAVGYRIIDTTTLTNGVHTISWIVTDDAGISEGIGSRYFTVSNGSGAVTSAATAPLVNVASDVRSVPVDRTSVAGRRGFDLSAEWTSYAIGPDGRAVVNGEELDRFELALAVPPGQRVTGYLRVGDRLDPLPAGSRLDPSTGAFTWAPGVGFVGRYDLVFVRSQRDRVTSRQDVRIVLHQKRSASRGVQIAIDAPRPEQAVDQPFAITGWAADLDAREGTGVDALHVWAYPVSGGPPLFLGAATYGVSRPDVAQVHGGRFRDSAFGLIAQGLPPGAYDLAVFAWSTALGDFAPARTVRVIVR